MPKGRKRMAVSIGFGKPAASSKAAAKKKAALKPKLAAFAAAEAAPRRTVAEELRTISKKASEAKSLKAAYASMEAEDATVFKYDEALEDSKPAEAPRHSSRSKPEARASREVKGESVLIPLLLRKAKERERWQARVAERKVQKEQAEDAHLYGDKPRFVTSAWKAKLVEDARWDEEEKKRAERERREDVRRQADMGAFYSNLLTSNSAFGAKPAADSRLSSADGSDDGVSRDRTRASGVEELRSADEEKRRRDRSRERSRPQAAAEEAKAIAAVTAEAKAEAAPASAAKAAPAAAGAAHAPAAAATASAVAKKETRKSIAERAAAAVEAARAKPIARRSSAEAVAAARARALARRAAKKA